MQAGGKPWWAGRRAWSGPWRLASSTSAARARSRGRSQHRLDVGDRVRDAPPVHAERGHRAAELGGDPVLGPLDVGGEPEQEAWVARRPPAAEPRPSGHGHGAGEAPDVAVGHQAGGHDGVEHGLGIVGEVESHRRDPHRGADAGGALAGLPRVGARLQLVEHLAEAPAHAAVRPA